jgi:hypothetical protein
LEVQIQDNLKQNFIDTLDQIPDRVQTLEDKMATSHWIKVAPIHCHGGTIRSDNICHIENGNAHSFNIHCNSAYKEIKVISKTSSYVDGYCLRHASDAGNYQSGVNIH